MKKLSKLLIVFLLLAQLLPTPVIAQELMEQELNQITENDKEEIEEVVIFSEEIDDEVELYKDEEGIEVLALIPDDTVVELLKEPEEDKDYLFIKYTIDGTENEEDFEEALEGYVHKNHVVNIEDAPGYRDARIEQEIPEKEESNNDTEKTEDQEKESTISISSDSMELEEDNEEEVKVQEVDKPKKLTGLALKQPVHVYANKSRDANIIKSYSYGHVLKYRTYTDEWYEATVYIKGEPQTGYIHTSDVGEVEGIPSVTGVALKQPTAVYSKMNKSSSVLRRYQQGHILKYKAYDTNWFIATVYINGKARTGYIHAKDVETATSYPTTLQGVGVKNPTSVYASATTKSSKLKSYNYGNILKYRTFTSSWYVTTVYVNGKANTGYINKSDVGSMDTVLSGYGQASPTTVYSSTSKNSTKLKSYVIGSKLKYRPHTKIGIKLQSCIMAIGRQVIFMLTM